MAGSLVLQLPPKSYLFFLLGHSHDALQLLYLRGSFERKQLMSNNKNLAVGIGLLLFAVMVSLAAFTA